jgi:hypothetical protein
MFMQYPVNCPKCKIEHWDEETETEYCVDCSCEECNAPLVEDFDGLCGACDNILTVELSKLEQAGFCMRCQTRKATTNIEEDDGCQIPVCELCEKNQNQWIEDLVEEHYDIEK